MTLKPEPPTAADIFRWENEGGKVVDVPGGGVMLLPKGVEFLPNVFERRNEMIVWMIWAVDGSDPDEVAWLVTAWDEESKDQNFDGWENDLRKAEESFGGRNVRVTTTTVDFDAVLSAFQPTEV